MMREHGEHDVPCRKETMTKNQKEALQRIERLLSEIQQERTRKDGGALISWPARCGLMSACASLALIDLQVYFKEELK